MTTLDIFATNIIGNNAVSNFKGENANRWLQIKSPSGSGSFGNFFIVKKLSPTDSQSVSSAIDSTTDTKSNITFDNNGNIKAPITVQNPLITESISPDEEDIKQFSNPNGDGYCESRDIIFSTNLKWILYRDKKDANQMYILYNPMHRKNVKKYYESITDGNSNAFGEDGGFMKTLIQKYRNLFTITPLNSSTKTKAVFAEPSCNCYDQHNCNNDYANFYISRDSSDKLGWSCACNAKSCFYTKDRNSDSFLNLFQQNLIKNVKCPSQVSFCNMAFSAAGNINVTNDSNIQQNCSYNQTETQSPTTQPQTQSPTTQSPTTQAQTQSPTTQSPTTQSPTKQPSATQAHSLNPLILGGGIGLGVIIIAILTFLIYKNK